MKISTYHTDYTQHYCHCYLVRAYGENLFQSLHHRIPRKQIRAKLVSPKSHVDPVDLSNIDPEIKCYSGKVQQRLMEHTLVVKICCNCRRENIIQHMDKSKLYRISILPDL